jgi:hypothetical protein
MIAFKLEDFEINASNLPDINNINMQAGGTADVAFMAYNKAAFDIKSPEIDQFPVSRNVCKVPSSTGVTFNTQASINAPTGASGETLRYQWYRNFAPISGATSSSYTLPTVTSSDLITYKVRIFNDFGAVDLPVSLSEGGTPTFWNGTTWNFPANFYDNQDPSTGSLLFPISDADRNLIFNADYSLNTDLEGCDCIVLAGKNVTIPAGKTLKLYSNLTVEGEQPILDIDGNPTGATIPAATFTLEDNASLIQTKPVTSNENSGDIFVEREASDLQTNAYVYWSSPVENFNLSGVPGSSSYRWEVNTLNANGTNGDWAAFSGAMTLGRGYIKRVPSAATFTTIFTGKPNNGLISSTVYKTTASLPAVEDRHWNLVGNPYPSAINADDFMVANTNIEGSVYIWMHDTPISNNPSNSPFYQNFVYNYGDQYLTYNGTSSVPAGFNGKIASGQGFFVKVLGSASNSSSLSFTNSMRYDSSENAYDNSEFFRNTNANSTAEVVQKELLWLSLVNEANTSSITLVGYVEGATNGQDRLYDATFNGAGMSLYSLLENNRKVIQGRALPFDETDMVPLGIDITENGIYKIGIDHIEGSLFVDDEQPIYLEDTYLNVIHDLRNLPYSFTGTVGTTTDRFILRYTSSQLSVDEYEANDTFVYIKDQHFYLKSTKNIKSVVLYDLTGKQLMTYNLDRNTNTFDTSFQYPRGVYLAVIELDDNTGVITKKLMN